MRKHFGAWPTSLTPAQVANLPPIHEKADRAWYARWDARHSAIHAIWQREKEDTRAAVLACLEAGGTVFETLGQHRKAWHLGVSNFIPPYNLDPEYLASHIMARRSFGTTLELENKP
jgi:hypothetical protein